MQVIAAVSALDFSAVLDFSTPWEYDRANCL